MGLILLTSLTAEAVLLRRVFADGFPSVTYEHWNGRPLSYRLLLILSGRLSHVR